MKVFVTLLAPILCALSASAQTAPKITLEKWLGGFQSPVYITSDGTDRLFVVEQPGRIKLIKNGEVQPKAFLDIRKEVDFGGEKGLLSVAFHPDFAHNGYFYVDFTADRPKLLTVIAEFHVDPNSDVADATTERVLLTIDQPYANHNGGQLQFGPDGMLYIGMGDGGLHDDPHRNAQNPHSLLGKILRIDVNNREPYGIPKDNPWVNGKLGRPEVFAWGLRNPWRFSFDRKTGEIWAGDVGQNTWEEVDLITKGGNYGWRAREATHPTPSLKSPERTPDNAIDPIVEYPHLKGQVQNPNLSITGGYVYRGTKYPALAGWYLYGDYASGRIWALKYENGKLLTNSELLQENCSPSSFGEDKDGELYLCDYGHGRICKIVAE